MKLIFLILIGSVIAPIGHADPVFSHQETGISLPDKIAGFNLGESTAYDGTGRAIPYHGPQTEATIFIRPVQTQEIGSPALVIEQSLAAVRELEKRGTYSEVKIVESNGQNDVPGWVKSGFTAKADNIPVVSLIYATIQGEWVVKIRLTSSHPDFKEMGLFIAEIQKIVKEARAKP